MTVNLIEKATPDLPVAIKTNEIDLALPLISQLSEATDPTFFEILPLETEDLYIVISDSLLQKYFGDSYPDCKTSFVSGVSLDDFADIPMFLHPSSSHMHETIVLHLAQNGRPPFIRVKTSLIYHKKKLLTKPLQDSIAIIRQMYAQRDFPASLPPSWTL